ncbi:hypothetical protein MRX96_015319 [Rhipicephalus microplus]
MVFEPTRAELNGLAVHRLNLSATSSALHPIHASYTLVWKTDHSEKKKLRDSARMGFEPTRAELNELAVHRLNLSATSSALHPIRACYILVSKTDDSEKKKLRDSTRMGFEHTRAEFNGLAVHRLNISATSTALHLIRAAYTQVSKTDHLEKKKLRDSTRMGFEPTR